LRAVIRAFLSLVAVDRKAPGPAIPARHRLMPFPSQLQARTN